MKNNIELSGCTELNANELLTIEGGSAIIEKMAYGFGYLLGAMGKIQRHNTYNVWIF